MISFLQQNINSHNMLDALIYSIVLSYFKDCTSFLYNQMQQWIWPWQAPTDGKCDEYFWWFGFYICTNTVHAQEELHALIMHVEFSQCLI